MPLGIINYESKRGGAANKRKKQEGRSRQGLGNKPFQKSDYCDIHLFYCSFMALDD